MKPRFNVLLFLLLFLPASTLALTIDNRAQVPALVTVKNAKFEIVGTWQVSAESVEDIDLKPVKAPEKSIPTKSGKAKKAVVYQVETYLKDPKDPTSIPTFFHDVGPNETLCVPQNLCPEPKKKKKGGTFNPFKIW